MVVAFFHTGIHAGIVDPHTGNFGQQFVQPIRHLLPGDVRRPSVGIVGLEFPVGSLVKLYPITSDTKLDFVGLDNVFKICKIVVFFVDREVFREAQPHPKLIVATISIPGELHFLKPVKVGSRKQQNQDKREIQSPIQIIPQSLVVSTIKQLERPFVYQGQPSFNAIATTVRILFGSAGIQRQVNGKRNENDGCTK